MILNLTKEEIEKVHQESIREGLGLKGEGFSLGYLGMVSRGEREVSKPLAPIIARVTGRFSVMQLLYPDGTEKVSNG
ncbi:MAG: hypothetical protein IH577_04530 [Deltaproteobacteria bacterium]|nr:hypothetical protein [Deltaproteobacteria bacterium]